MVSIVFDCNNRFSNKIISSMASNSQYNYDFSYSITQDHSRQLQSTHDTQFATIAALLAESRLIMNKDVVHFWIAISRQPAMTLLSGQLQELAEIQLELNGRRTMRDTDRQYFLREELCGPLKELQTMMGRQREYYTNLTILLLNLVLLRIIHVKYEVSLQPTVLFHFLHWELKGQHSTNHFYDTLSADTLKRESIVAFVEGETMVQESVSMRSLQGSVSFKRPPSMVSSFALAFNKENQSLNEHFKPSFKNFKKTGNGPIIDLNTTRPSSFANCGFK